MKEKIGDFLMDIAQTYPIRQGVNAERVIENARVYLIEKLYNKEIDFQKAKTLMFDNYEKKNGFPEPRVLYNYLIQCEVRHYDPSKNEGSLVVITLPNGYPYVFTIHGNSRPYNEIVDEIKFKYGSCKVETYPPGTVMIGKTIVAP